MNAGQVIAVGVITIACGAVYAGLQVHGGHSLAVGTNSTAQVTASSASSEHTVSVPTPVKRYYTIKRAAPVCNTFEGAVTARAVMPSQNSTVIDAVLTQHGCELTPEEYTFKADQTLVTQLQAGVVVVTIPEGNRIYTTRDSVWMTQR